MEFTEHSAQVPAKQQTIIDAAQQSNLATDSQVQLQHWGENRLADVVKGTAKTKTIGGSKETGSGPESDSPRALSPQHHLTASHTAGSLAGRPQTSNVSLVSVKDSSTVTNTTQTSAASLTPPNSPEK